MNRKKFKTERIISWKLTKLKNYIETHTLQEWIFTRRDRFFLAAKKKKKIIIVQFCLIPLEKHLYKLHPFSKLPFLPLDIFHSCLSSPPRSVVFFLFLPATFSTLPPRSVLLSSSSSPSPPFLDPLIRLMYTGRGKSNKGVGGIRAIRREISSNVEPRSFPFLPPLPRELWGGRKSPFEAITRGAGEKENKYNWNSWKRKIPRYFSSRDHVIQILSIRSSRGRERERVGFDPLGSPATISR